MQLADRLSNLISGLGGQKDKAASTFHSYPTLTPLEALNAYRTDWIARKVVDIPAMDMVRAGRNWQADDKQIRALEGEERRLRIKQRLLQALKWSRLFGGAALILGTDQPPETPLDLNRIGLGGLTYVHACGRLEITAGALDRDPMSPTYGEPTYYQLNRVPTVSPYATSAPPTQVAPGLVQIHPTRVIRFVGAELPDPTMFSGFSDGWGDSILQSLNDAVINAGIASGGIASLVLEAKVDVYSIPNLTQSVGNADYRSRMLERFGLANTGKSLQNALLLDANETYTQKSINFSALPDILTLYLEIAAAAADIPATRMLAKQSKGLGNGGEGDLKNYYDKIGSDQEMTLRPAIEKLDEVLIRSALGSRPPEIYWGFAPLWQMSEVERAGIRKSDAETAASYVASGLIPKAALAAAVQNSIVEANAYPGLEAALNALGDADEGQAWTGVGKDELTGLLAAWQSGAITHETLFDVLQRGGMIAADVTFEAYAEQIENEAPPPTAGIEGITLDPPKLNPTATGVSTIGDEGNPNHVASGPGGGQFTSAGGVGAGVSKLVSDLTGEDKAAIRKYTGSGHAWLNDDLTHDQLRKGNTLSEKDEHSAKALSAAIEKGRLTQATTLHRGLTTMGARNLMSHDLKKGTVITDRGFLSTSHDKGIAKSFAGQSREGATMELRVKAGHTALDVGQHGDRDTAHEREVIFPRGTSYRVISWSSKSRHLVAEIV